MTENRNKGWDSIKTNPFWGTFLGLILSALVSWVVYRAHTAIDATAYANDQRAIDGKFQAMNDDIIPLYEQLISIVEKMATKQDIKEISDRMNSQATKKDIDDIYKRIDERLKDLRGSLNP